MATAHIYPNQYINEDGTLQNVSNMFAPVSSTTYTTFTGESNYSISGLNTYNFASETIPSGAMVSSFAVKVKIESTSSVSLNEQYMVYGIADGTGSLFYCNDTNYSTLDTYTLPNTGYDANGHSMTMTWDVLKQHLSGTFDGSNLYGLFIFIGAPSSNSVPNGVKIYGMEVEVNYTVPSSSKIFNLILPAKGKI